MKVHFEDSSLYYASEEMMAEELALSMASGIVYDISDELDVKLIMKATDEFVEIANEDIMSGDLYFHEFASVATNNGTGKLEWEHVRGLMGIA